MTFPVEPPRNLVMPADLQHGSLLFSGVVFAIVVALALWRILVRREPVLFFCVLGGMAAVIVEPLCDVIGMIYHPEIGQITAYEALGRKIPWHVVLLLSCYYALFAWLLTSPRGQRLGRAGFCKLFEGLGVVSTILEISPPQDVLVN